MANPLDLSKFRKVSSNDSHTILKHKDGHEIRVLHKPLSPQVKSQLDKLPHYSDGSGYVEDPDSPANRAGAAAPGSSSGKEVQDSYNKSVNESPLDKFKRAFGSDTKVKKYANGTPDKPIQGDEQIVPASRLESQYVPEELAAQQSIDQSVPAQIDQEIQAETPIDPTHAHLAEAVKNLSQKFIPQTPQQSLPPDDKASPTSPQVDPVASPAVIPSKPQGSLVHQAQANTEAANAAEIQAAQNTQQSQAKEADIYGQQAKQMQDLHAKYEDIGNQLHHKFENVAEQVEKGHIDPSHWWNQKSTGSKVLTAIGMLFAGAGLGASGHPEMAGKVIDEAINRDIDAQKADLSNKNTLLSKYMDMYNSLPQAEAAARLTMSAGVEGLLKQQAAKLGSANAVQTALASIASRRQALLPQIEGLAKGQVMAQMYQDMAKPSAPTSSEEQAYQNQMQRMRILNPDLGKDMENKYLPNVGASRIPVPEKVREEITARKDLSDKIAQLEVFAKQHQGTTMDRATVNQGKAMAAQVQDAYRTAHQQGVFKESEAKFINSIVKADPTSFFAESRTLPGYRQARKFNDDTIKQYYKSYGIKPFSGSNELQSGNQNKEALEWLKANPNDPRAAAVKQKLGL